MNKTTSSARGSHIKSSCSTLLIGSGRLAHHLVYWFADLPCSVDPWQRGQPLPDFNEYERIMLAISDHALAEFIACHLKDYKGTVIHFSGTTEVENALGFHPLMSFTETLLAPEAYAEMSFVGTVSAETFRAALPEFKNSYFQITAKDRALYHALCVASGNFSQMLWHQVAKLFSERLNIGPEALAVFAEHSTAQALSSTFSKPSGPFSRHDLSTIQKNKEALNDTSLAPIYEAFQTLYQQEYPHEEPT